MAKLSAINNNEKKGADDQSESRDPGCFEGDHFE